MTRIEEIAGQVNMTLSHHANKRFTWEVMMESSDSISIVVSEWTKFVWSVDDLNCWSAKLQFKSIDQPGRAVWMTASPHSSLETPIDRSAAIELIVIAITSTTRLYVAENM